MLTIGMYCPFCRSVEKTPDVPRPSLCSNFILKKSTGEYRCVAMAARMSSRLPMMSSKKENRTGQPARIHGDDTERWWARQNKNCVIVLTHRRRRVLFDANAQQHKYRLLIWIRCIPPEHPQGLRVVLSNSSWQTSTSSRRVVCRAEENELARHRRTRRLVGFHLATRARRHSCLAMDRRQMQASDRVPTMSLQTCLLRIRMQRLHPKAHASP